ncbi:MAG: response regulator transcription factor [Caldilineaceae bacterium]|nr:response regulator transcription factor [Caldilineaceae bacterium]MBP8109923.1 response regulator transcription factor [Caldilineaceae bacterium]MBP8123983.1 response regulator transcription factor [Caldilineaceae bacterium]MBP9074022.1 response regulator transcription factor [Caldilineaceae bacterium]
MNIGTITQMSQSAGKATGNLGNSPASIRLLIADDQPRVRQSLEALLTALRWSTPSRTQFPIEIVGEADDGQQVVAQVQALHPDVVVLDLPTHDSADRVVLAGSRLDGLAAIRTIKRRWPHVRVVVLTMYATDRAAVLLAGADAFLLKGCPTSELLDAVMPAAH